MVEAEKRRRTKVIVGCRQDCGAEPSESSVDGCLGAAAGLPADMHRVCREYGYIDGFME